jgi:hypothetical protein
MLRSFVRIDNKNDGVELMPLVEDVYDNKPDK